MDYILLHHEG